MSIFPGWRQVVVAAVGQGLSTTSVVTAYSVVAVPLAGAFHPSRTALVLTITLVMLAISVLSPPIGAAMDRYSLRRLMLAGTGFLTAGFLALSFTTSMVQVYVVYAVILAVSNILLGPLAASALLGRWFSRKRGLAMGIAALGIAVAGLILPPLIHKLIEVFEWRMAFRVLAGLYLVILVPTILLLQVDKPSLLNLHPDGDKEPPAGVQESDLPLMTTGAILRDPTFWLITIALAVAFSGGTGLLPNLSPIVMDKGVSSGEAAILISILSAGSFSGKLLFAVASDRVDLRIALGGCLFLIAVAMFFFWHFTAYALLAMGAFIAGVAMGAIVPLWGFLVTRSFGAQNVGRVMGIMTTAETPLLLLSPPLFGWFFDNTGSYTGAYMLYIGLSAAAIALVPRIRTHVTMVAAKPATS